MAEKQRTFTINWHGKMCAKCWFIISIKIRNVSYGSAAKRSLSVFW